jgi:hypothetical protein
LVRKRTSPDSIVELGYFQEVCPHLGHLPDNPRRTWLFQRMLIVIPQDGDTIRIVQRQCGVIVWSVSKVERAHNVRLIGHNRELDEIEIASPVEVVRLWNRADDD